MDKDIETEYDAMETLCVLHWMNMSDLELAKAEAHSQMLNAHFKSAPLEKLPNYLKKRIELHEILLSVVKASEEDLVDENFRIGVFEELSEIFEELEGPERADIEGLKKSERLFVRYGLFRRFQLGHKVDPSAEETICSLPAKEYSKYFELLQKVLELCDLAREKYAVVVEEPSNKEEFAKIFDILGQGSFKKFNNDIFNNFVRVFCGGLHYFHGILGRPKHFQESGVLNDDFLQENNDTFMSSCQSVNDSVEITDTENVSPKKRAVKTPIKSMKKRTTLRDMIRSRSPPRESEMMKPEGILWDDSTSDMLSVSGSATKRVKWTAQESKDLVEGVKKYGRGEWALIKADGRLKLGHKSNVQLKDRWRNLTKNDPALRTLR